MKDKITAVVVTFNRLNFLKELIDNLKRQTQELNDIIVVNNSSTDGTAEWLLAQDGLTVINQENTGSSGGQNTGFETAYNSDAEWIWVMDDDVIPELTCLEILFENISEKRIHTPLRYNNTGNPFLNDVKSFNLTNPFKSLWRDVFTEVDLEENNISAEGITFEGPLFHRSLIEKIGLPEKKFFIYADDTEFFIRAKKIGFDIFVIKNAISNRKLPYLKPTESFSWKHYYVIRNIIAIDVLHGNSLVRIFRPFAYLIKWLFRSKNFNDFKTTLKAFKDGYFYKSE